MIPQKLLHNQDKIAFLLQKNYNYAFYATKKTSISASLVIHLMYGGDGGNRTRVQR